jgi:mannose-1-phosphate guanylyltransferase/phosphomannomutase
MDVNAVTEGGVGGRSRPLINGVPMPVIPVANKPMAGRTLALLRRHGLHDLNTPLHFQSKFIDRLFKVSLDSAARWRV